MSSMMMCPICGKQFPTEEATILENGNVACQECAQAEVIKQKAENEQKDMKE